MCMRAHEICGCLEMPGFPCATPKRKSGAQIIVSFYQVSAAFLTNIDVNWPKTMTAIWKFFSFLTMEVLHISPCCKFFHVQQNISSVIVWI